jgi:hypothetical protein
MRDFTLNICPTFYCEKNCDYCYLGVSRKNTAILDINKLEYLLNYTYEYITDYYKRTYNEDVNIYIEIFGGDLKYLSVEYINKFFTIIRKFNSFPINIVINKLDEKVLSELKRLCKGNIAITLNKRRKDYYDNLKWLESHPEFDILTVYFNDEEFYDILYKLPNNYTKKLNLIQYYPTFYSKHLPLNTKDYLRFYESNFIFFNNDILNQCLEQTWNPYMDSHIFINPFCQFGSTSYMMDCTETFLWYNNLDTWESMCIGEKQLYPTSIWNNIPVEHIRPEDPRPYKDLLEAYKNWKDRFTK